MELGNQIYEMLEELAQFSAPGPGVTRLSFTEEHKKARDLLKKWMEETGLRTETDAIGNLIGSYEADRSSKTIVIGSHQDSVVMGGKYDGILGIVVPLVAVGKLIREGRLRCSVKIAAFADEEGVRFQTTYMGSMAFNGHLLPELLERKDQNGVTLREAINAFGGSADGAVRQAGSDGAVSRAGKDEAGRNISASGPVDEYLELHIEQGPVLEAENSPVGVVTSIQASRRYEAVIDGMAGHAGTIPMALRHDPMMAAAKILAAAYDIPKTVKEPLVFTVGELQITPGAVNVIPARVRFMIDIRSPKEETILEAMEQVRRFMEQTCKETGTEYTLTNCNRVLATGCDETIVKGLQRAMERTGLKPFALPSGAGHDAQEMATVAPVGMLFVRCKGGISHSPAEEVSAEDMEAAAKTLMEYLAMEEE